MATEKILRKVPVAVPQRPSLPGGIPGSDSPRPIARAGEQPVPGTATEVLPHDLQCGGDLSNEMERRRIFKNE